jgi:hypothetical protein
MAKLGDQEAQGPSALLARWRKRALADGLRDDECWVWCLRLGFECKLVCMGSFRLFASNSRQKPNFPFTHLFPDCTLPTARFRRQA